MKDIKGYEGLYAVTSCGKVWSYRSNKFLKTEITTNGYLRVALVKKQKYNTPNIFFPVFAITFYFQNFLMNSELSTFSS